MATKLHRGRSKGEKKPLTLHLTENEWERLKLTAEQNMRSATSQALFIVVSALRPEPSSSGESN